ncbi:cupin domain-containing protein [Gordonia polyisoprenivorans VH2]|uniref:Cupin domain-containing protein n=1 Tax=Gordonia polyisoprenivorans (strain DSM 44266 / VH2) TaxID=1112204 RepID=H6MT73_GORPV|nr:cupin [Gordonia polyisoprenivorans]AFA71439.1 cupin domain-containing protein [Gordonia polyisoprenivorans VH2]OZC33344.1 cupin [Gordonia polyisoprenivorans]UZF56761.1 cupin [Gordonia polyisoprenivorans]
MVYKVVRAAEVSAGHGPHPAGSPYDKRISDALGLSLFEVYQVELPAGAETVQHDHLDDGNEDMYAVIRGSGWAVVDGKEVPVQPGQYVSVSVESRRFMRAGNEGMIFIAVCAGVRT